MTLDYAMKHFEYLKEGKLSIKVKRYQCDIVGNVLELRPHHTGYTYTTHKGKTVAVHRIIFLLHHGKMPKIVDHINRDRSDNRIENLREVTRSINNFNCALLRESNTSGFRGVSREEKASKYQWKAQISVRGKKLNLGRYTTKEEAYHAYCKASKTFFPTVTL